MKTDKNTPEEIRFLKKLNSLLTCKEMELFERCWHLVKKYNKQLIKNGGDLDDYEIEVIVEYCTSGCFPKYVYHTIADKRMCDMPDRERTFGSNADWSDRPTGTFPDIGEKVCYFMHCLYYHSRDKKSIFKIRRIDFEIAIREQQFVNLSDHENI